MTLPDVWWSADPGVTYYAWALWYGSQLEATAMAPLDNAHWPIDLIVLEKPQVYRNSPARNADLVDLAVAAATIGARFKEAVYYLPREWKGQIPKSKHHPRILAQLTDREKSCLPTKKGELKHVLDAVGLGLYHMRVKGIARCVER